MKNFGIIVLFIFLCGCNNYPAAKQNNGQDSIVQRQAPSGAISIEPLFSSVDSLQVLFFDDPYGDSRKYTRFYTVVNSSDSNFLVALNQQLTQPYTIQPSTDSCRSEGKMFLLAKGDPVKTLYFSTKCPRCCYVYFIKDGNFYYLPLHPGFIKAILEIKKQAKRP